jgi:Uma2 family endonuclease
MTAEELFITPNLGRCELMHGELITTSLSSSLHGRYCAFLVAMLWGYVDERRLGMVFGAETGFIIERNPDTVRAPDVAFVVKERLPDPLPSGFFPGPPDLAVEVLSPSDRASEIMAKTRQWLSSGCREVWIVDPETKTITIHSANGAIAQLVATDILESTTLLPGFRKPLAEMF